MSTTITNGRIFYDKLPHFISQKAMFYNIKGKVLQTKKAYIYARNAEKQVISL